jgi:hypothetical protein
VSYDEHVFRDARTALRAVRAGCPVRVGPLVLAEMEEFDRRCPYYCDGSQHGVAAYLEGLVARTGLSLERVSYTWRTTPSLLRFLAALSGAKPVSRAGNVARCAICGWRIDDTGDHAPQPDPLGLLGDVCVWCWRTRADRAVAAGREVCARHGGTTWRGGYCDRWATGRSSGPCIVHRLRLRRRETIECEDLS